MEQIQIVISLFLKKTSIVQSVTNLSNSVQEKCDFYESTWDDEISNDMCETVITIFENSGNWNIDYVDKTDKQKAGWKFSST